MLSGCAPLTSARSRAGTIAGEARALARASRPRRHGLDKLLDGYGIEMKKEAILDWGWSISIPVETQSGQRLYFQAPSIVQVMNDPHLGAKAHRLDSTFAAFFRLDEVSFPFPSTLVAHPEKQPDAKMKVVARSTGKSTGDSADTIAMKIASDWKPKGEAGPRAMAIVLQGKIKSAFGGQGALGVPAASVSPGGARLLVVSASQFFANPFARAGNPPPLPPQLAMMGPMGGDEDLQMLAGPYAQRYLTNTILALKNTVDWMGDEHGYHVCLASALEGEALPHE